MTELQPQLSEHDIERMKALIKQAELSKKVVNHKLDLIWIIPKIIGEIAIYIGIPIFLTTKLSIVGALSPTGLTYIGLSLLLIMHMKFTWVYELLKIKWK